MYKVNRVNGVTDKYFMQPETTERISDRLSGDVEGSL